MSGYDVDSLNIEITADVGKAQKSLENLTKSLVGLRNNLGGLDSKPMKQVRDTSEDASEVIENLRRNFANVGKDFKLPTGMKELRGLSKKLSNDFDRLMDKESKMVSLGNFNTSSFEGLEFDISKTANRLDMVNEKLAEMQRRTISIESAGSTKSENSLPSSGMVSEKSMNYDAGAMKAVYGEGAEGIRNWNDAIVQLGNNAANVFDQMENDGVQATESLKNSVSGLGNGLKETSAESEKGRFSISNLGSVFSSLKSKIPNLDEMKNSIGGFIGKLKLVGSHISKIAKSLGILKKSAHGTRRSFLSVVKYAIGLRLMYKAIEGIKKGFVEGTKNLVQYSDSYNTAVSSLTPSLKQLQNSFTVAFAPIVEVVAPYLTRLIQMVSSASNALGQFFGALTGKQFVAQATKINEDYAASLDKVGSSSDKANKKLGLQGFDKLNNLSSSKSSGSGASSQTSPKDMFETVEIGEKYATLADKIKEAWKNTDFTTIGAGLGESLKNAFSNVDYEGIKEKAGNVGKSIASFINGFVGVDGLGSEIGRNLAESMNAGLEFAYQYTKTLDWGKIGLFIANTFNGWQENFDFAKLGKTLGGWVNGIFTTLNALIKNTDWGSLGKNIMTTIVNFFGAIDWGQVGGIMSGMVSGLFNFISGLFDGVNWKELPKSVITGIVDFFSGIDWASVMASVGNLAATILKVTFDFAQGLILVFGNVAKTIRDYFVNNIKAAGWEKDKGLLDNGKAILTGVYNGIKNVITSVGSWIATNIFQPFVGAFKSKFGIAGSSSTTFSEFGKNMMNGLKNGILGGIDAVKNAATSIGSAIFNALKSAWNSLATWLNDKLTIKLDTNNIIGKGIQSILGSDTIKIANIPRFANGGYVQSSDLFMANENGVPELVGTVGGKTAVASGQEITGISDAVYTTASQEIALLKQQNQLLSQILSNGNNTIDEDEIFNIVLRKNQEYYHMNGHGALAYEPFR